MKIGIVGGGIMGVSLGYYLTKLGAQVEIFEASPHLGGLAAPISLADGTEVDRFYHVILSSDRHIAQACQELSIEDRLRFNETKMGFFYNGAIYSMNNIIEFLKFPPLGWIDRFRLGLTVLYAQMVRDWHRLEGINVEKWLVGLSGRTTYANIWRPMLRAKFDGSFVQTPATYIWARLVRMKSTRSGAAQKEMAGHLTGGFQTLIKAMAGRIQAAGGKIELNTPVDEIRIERKKTHDGWKAGGLIVGGKFYPYDAVVSTQQAPVFARLIPGAGGDYLDLLGKMQYLGIICGLLVLDRPLTGYWTLNITGDEIPFTGVIETTSYIDPQYSGGHHLVYLPKYTAPGSDWQRKSDAEIREIWLRSLKQIVPDFDPAWIRWFLIQRERYVEPLHNMNETGLIPAVQTPVDNLYLASTAQIYPSLTNTESILPHAQKAAGLVMAGAVPEWAAAGEVPQALALE